MIRFITMLLLLLLAAVDNIKTNNNFKKIAKNYCMKKPLKHSPIKMIMSVKKVTSQRKIDVTAN